MRTFEYSDATSHKFWNIDVKGTSFTVTYGRIGSTGQTQVKSFPDEAKTQKEADKLIREKTGKGYKETTPAAKAVPSSLRESLEAALVEEPDELANHMAYADYLSEQNDPLGEFIRVQLSLEDESKPAGERKKLQQQEKKLLDKHGREWLGELAPFLLDEKAEAERHWDDLKVTYTLRRGWLDTLVLKRPTSGFVRVLARSPQIRLLRHLEVPETSYEEPSTREPGDGIPERCYHPAFYLLARCSYLSNVRVFVVGERMSVEEDLHYTDYGPNCHAAGDGVLGPIKHMTKLEELYLLAHRVDTSQLFGLETLNHLRVLQVDHTHEYPVAKLAKNPSLGKLTHLYLWPHAIEYENEPKAYIRAPGVKAVVTSPTLKSLTHLRIRCSDMGDKGMKDIVESGILKRLNYLDLRHGCITDKGARHLAGCADVKNLTHLDLIHNSLTAAGIEALKAAGVKALTDNQWSPMGDEEADTEYLGCGDIE